MEAGELADDMEYLGDNSSYAGLANLIWKKAGKDGVSSDAIWNLSERFLKEVLANYPSTQFSEDWRRW